MSLDIFNHVDFQTLQKYEDTIADPESIELYEIHKVGHEKFGQTYLTPLQEYYILDAYYNCNVTPKVSAESLEKDLGISAITIRKVIRRYGDIRKLSDAMKLYKVNEDYFETIDTPEKAYWLGLLYADGHVTKEKDRVIISLQERDGYLVEQFAKDINYTGVIEDDCARPYGDDRTFPQKRVRVNSRKMASDLIRHGCLPNKTFNLSYPYWLEENLRPHFARGFIDGDGWIGIQEDGVLFIGWCGTWAMTFEIAMHFWNKVGYRNNSTYTQGRIFTNKTSGEMALKICDHLYANATRKLYRKYDKYIAYKNKLNGEMN